MLVLGRLAEVGGLAHLPQPHQIGAVARAALDELVGSELAQRRLVLRFVAQSQPRLRRRGDERFHQGFERGEIEPRVAPLGGGDRRERMAFDRGDDVGVEVGRFARHPKGAVLAEPPGAAGDLPDLLGMEPAPALAVELAQAGEGDMVDVHVEAHADRVGGDEEVDLAGLEEIDLRIAGARGKRAHHHRRAAALAADQLGDRVDLVGGEGDDRAAPRQPRQFLRPGVDELRETLAGLDFRAGREPVNERRGRRRSHQHGLGAPARVKQAVGEDVAALGSAMSWISSTARNSTRRSSGIASTVHTQ